MIMKKYSSKLLDQVLVVSINKTFRTLLLASGLMIVFTFQAKAQEPEVIQNWTPLEEAEFHFDVSYAVVKCNPDADPVVIINAFNEGGTYSKVGFSLAISDAAGNTAEIEIPLFATKLGDMFIASCASDDHANLRFAVPAGIDAATMKMAITYNTGS
jgi:hypothetical protein